MSHIHLPDGILPLWLWLLGYLMIGLYLAAFSIFFKKSHTGKKIPLIGVFAALMIVAMSVEIVPIAYHINLAALAGIILGPVLSVLAILVVNIILAFLGHGGLTVVGLNTIVVSLEAVLAYFGFRFISSKVKNISVAAFLATFLALVVSSSATIGIVYLGTYNTAGIIQSVFEHNHQSSSGSIIQFEGGHEDNLGIQKDMAHNSSQNRQKFNIKKFILSLLLLGSVGWIIESIVTAFIVNYIKRIKPEILPL